MPEIINTSGLAAPNAENPYSVNLRDEKLNNTFQQFTQASSSVTNELALMRTLITSLLARMPQGANGQLPLEYIELASKLVDRTAQVAERVEKLQLKMGTRVGLEQIETIIEKVITIVMEEAALSPSKITDIVTRVNKLNLNISNAGILTYKEVYETVAEVAPPEIADRHSVSNIAYGMPESQARIPYQATEDQINLIKEARESGALNQRDTTYHLHENGVVTPHPGEE